MHLLVVLSPNVNEYKEQSLVQILAVISEAKVPLGQVLTQKIPVKSAYDSGIFGHVRTHIWVLLSRINIPEHCCLHLLSLGSAQSYCKIGHWNTQVRLYGSAYV